MFGKIRLLSISFFIFIFFSSLSAAPTISTITPISGSSSGGTEVIITGTGFTGTTAVSFGNIAASSFSVVSDTTLGVITPPHVPQTVPIVVTSQGESSSIIQNAYYVYQGNWEVYVANSNSNTISVVDAVQNSVINTINVEQNPCYVAFAPDGSQAFVANETSNTLSVIDRITQGVTSISSHGTFPNAMVFEPNGTSLYVVNENDGVIASIDPTTLTSTWEFSSGGNPLGLAITPDGTQLCFTNTSTNQVTFLNPENGHLINQTTTPLSPDCIVIHPNGEKGYIANNGSSSVSVINLFSNTIQTNISVGNNPCALAITPDGSILSVVNATDNSVTLIDTATDTVTTTLLVGVFPKNLIITPNGSKGYIVNNTSGSLSVVDLVNRHVSGTSITVGNNPYAIAMLPDGSKTYVANTGSSFLSIIETTSDAVIATPSVGNFSSSIAVTPDPAPLANFTIHPDSKKRSYTFDASISASPVGSVVDYFWDFGDGIRVHTASPIIKHRYHAAGVYLVTLTVTNTAGTSTQQIYSHSSSDNFNFLSLAITQSEVLTHNGGPTAKAIQTLNIQNSSVVFPPKHLRGKQFKVPYFTQSGVINILTWSSPKKGIPPVSYRIYTNSSLTKLVGEVPAHNENCFRDHAKQKNGPYKYFVVSVDRAGNTSEPASVVIHSCKKKKHFIGENHLEDLQDFVED